MHNVHWSGSIGSEYEKVLPRCTYTTSVSTYSICPEPQIHLLSRERLKVVLKAGRLTYV